MGDNKMMIKKIEDPEMGGDVLDRSGEKTASLHDDSRSQSDENDDDDLSRSHLSSSAAGTSAMNAAWPTTELFSDDGASYVSVTLQYYTKVLLLP